ncbi:MAG: hypothetical protein ACE5GV_00265 [Candidatus Scalindua sp.]
MESLITELYEKLQLLDGALAKFKEHPMHDEWLDKDEITLMCSVLEDNEEEEEISEAFEEAVYCQVMDELESNAT